ncbi:MAG: hypothetical protein AAGJ46_12390 [Planctomycetota bacterium]
MHLPPTTIRLLRRHPLGAALAAGITLATLAGLLPGSDARAQVPQRHWLHAGVMPPGAIGRQRLASNGSLSCYTQPVELNAPAGFELAAYSGGGLATPRAGSLRAGLAVGPVYRFKASGVIADEMVEVYPTVELIDRLYPPPGKKHKFPIPVELTREELRLAARGAFVTRVIYVEDPNQAIAGEEPVVDGRREQQWFEARPGQDPLLVADSLGRPVALLRIGSRLPGQGRYSDPPIQLYDGSEAAIAEQASPIRPDFGGVQPRGELSGDQSETTFGIETILTY